MNENKYSSLISFLFAEDRKKYGVAPNKFKKILADLWDKAGKMTKKTKGDRK